MKNPWLWLQILSLVRCVSDVSDIFMIVLGCILKRDFVNKCVALDGSSDISRGAIEHF